MKSKKDPGYIPPSTNPNIRGDNFLMYMYILALFADLDRGRENRTGKGFEMHVYGCQHTLCFQDILIHFTNYTK